MSPSWAVQGLLAVHFLNIDYLVLESKLPPVQPARHPQRPAADVQHDLPRIGVELVRYERIIIQLAPRHARIIVALQLQMKQLAVEARDQIRRRPRLWKIALQPLSQAPTRER